MSKISDEQIEAAVRDDIYDDFAMACIKELKELRAAKPTVPSSVREALEFYANEGTYKNVVDKKWSPLAKMHMPHGSPWSPCGKDKGKRARQALKDLDKE